MTAATTIAIQLTYMPMPGPRVGGPGLASIGA